MAERDRKGTALMTSLKPEGIFKQLVLGPTCAMVCVLAQWRFLSVNFGHRVAADAIPRRPPRSRRSSPRTA